MYHIEVLKEHGNYFGEWADISIVRKDGSRVAYYTVPAASKNAFLYYRSEAQDYAIICMREEPQNSGVCIIRLSDLVVYNLITPFVLRDVWIPKYRVFEYYYHRNDTRLYEAEFNNSYKYHEIGTNESDATRRVSSEGYLPIVFMEGYCGATNYLNMANVNTPENPINYTIPLPDGYHLPNLVKTAGFNAIDPVTFTGKVNRVNISLNLPVVTDGIRMGISGVIGKDSR